MSSRSKLAQMKYMGTSEKYKYVSLLKDPKDQKIWYHGRPRNTSGKVFEDERAAAVYVDKQLIIDGKDPVNVFKKK